MPAPKPMAELARILELFGWERRFCDLTKEEVELLIFAIQIAEDITKDIDSAKLEQEYSDKTGVWPYHFVPF